jgi:hypothetical protein
VLSHAAGVAHARVSENMDRASESGRAMETSVSDEGSVLEIVKKGGGVNALVGFEFYYLQRGEYGRKKVRVERVNPDGHTLCVMDVWEKRLIENIFPGEL